MIFGWICLRRVRMLVFVSMFLIFISVFADSGRNRQMGYRHIPDSRSYQQPAAYRNSVLRVSGN